MPTTGRNYSGEQRVNFESPAPFSKCLRAKMCSNINVYFDAQGCQILLLKESDSLLFVWAPGLYYQDCSDNNLGMTLTYFTAWSTQLRENVLTLDPGL